MTTRNDIQKEQRPISAADLLALARPRLLGEALAVVAAAYLIARPSLFHLEVLGWLLVGGALVLAGASALNQVLEKGSDGRMTRTRDRPLPAGRLADRTALAIGLTAAAAGLALLSVGVGWLTAAIALAGLGWYLGLYTPLKARSPIAVPVGAVAGALPVLMGWAAARGALGLEALMLFAIVFIWQLPHFLAIGWMHRRDYFAAGFRMVPVGDGDSAARTVAIAVLTTNLLLLPVSLLPRAFGAAGSFYGFGAAALGLVYLTAGCIFFENVLAKRGIGRGEDRRAGAAVGSRRLLRVSVAYLPALLAVMAIDRWAG